MLPNKKISNIVLSCVAVAAFWAPDAANAGELIRGIRSSGGYYGYYSRSMTDAQRQSGSVFSNSNSVAMIDSTYHGSNYYSYELARRNYQRALRGYASHSNQSYNNWQFGGGSTTPYAQVGATPVLAVATQTYSMQQPRATTADVQPRPATFRQSTTVARRVPQQPTVEMIGSPAKSEQMVEQPKQKSLFLLSDRDKETSPNADSDHKNSIWTHFKNALTGR